MLSLILVHNWGRGEGPGLTSLLCGFQETAGQPTPGILVRIVLSGAQIGVCAQAFSKVIIKLLESSQFGVVLCVNHCWHTGKSSHLMPQKKDSQASLAIAFQRSGMLTLKEFTELQSRNGP